MTTGELQKFVDMVGLYDQVGDVRADEMSDIDTIENLSNNDDLKAVNSLYNEDEEFNSADEMMSEHFGHDTESLNALANEFGYQKIA